jgi:hypothetical protein
MKKFQVLAGIASTVAIAGGIAFGDAASAEACFYNQSRAAKSGSGTLLVGSGGSDQMNPWKSYKAAALGFLGVAGVLGGSAGYMSYRAGQRASAACAAMSDNFEVFEQSIDPIADADVSEYLEMSDEVEPNVAPTQPSEIIAVVREHPEAPGGELDLPVVEVVELRSSIAIEPRTESAIVK